MLDFRQFSNIKTKMNDHLNCYKYNQPHNSPISIKTEKQKKMQENQKSENGKKDED